MKLDKLQKTSLQNILGSPDFTAVEYFFAELAKDIGVAPVPNITQWDFDKGALQKEYQIALLKQLVSLMEQAAMDGGEDD